jgi:hypothetical protein
MALRLGPPRASRRLRARDTPSGQPADAHSKTLLTNRAGKRSGRAHRYIAISRHDITDGVGLREGYLDIMCRLPEGWVASGFPRPMGSLGFENTPGFAAAEAGGGDPPLAAPGSRISGESRMCRCESYF